MREIADRAAQGRACGNLGNTHYLLGSFTQAIKYHQEVSHFGIRVDSWRTALCWVERAMGFSQIVVYSSRRCACVLQSKFIPRPTYSINVAAIEYCARVR